MIGFVSIISRTASLAGTPVSMRARLAQVIEEDAITTGAQQCHDAQHQFAVTVHPLRRQPAQRAGTVPGATAAGTVAGTAGATARPTLQAAVAASAGPAGPAAAAVRGRAGRMPVRPSLTRLFRWRPLHRSARLSRGKLRRSQTFGIASSATLGMTDKELRRLCTTCLKRPASGFGSARRTLDSGCR